VSRSLRVHPRADLDVLEAFTFLAGRNPDAARRFLDAVERSLLAIKARPEDGHRYLHGRRENEDWRYVRLAGFKKYLVFYRLVGEETEVVRIVHGSRDLDAVFRVL
jgi:toxin ParE1/3/4